MGCRILYDDHQHHAVLYCSTSDWAFGPVFSDDADHDADERAHAFLRWLRDTDEWPAFEKHPIRSGRRDPRELTDSGLQAAYQLWAAQERAQWTREEAAALADGLTLD